MQSYVQEHSRIAESGEYGLDFLSGNKQEHSYNKTNAMHQFLKFIFGIELYMFRKGLLSIIRSLVLYTQQLVFVMQYYTPDDGHKTCPKHVEFYSKNKFEKLVHLVGFIIRIYHNARSFECQKQEYVSRVCPASYFSICMPPSAFSDSKSHKSACFGNPFSQLCWKFWKRSVVSERVSNI